MINQQTYNKALELNLIRRKGIDLSIIFSQNILYPIQSLKKRLYQPLLTIKKQYRQQYKQMAQEAAFDTYKHFDVSGMTSSIRYFEVYPFPYDCKDEKLKKQKPVLITYYDDQTTLFDLVKQFQSKVPRYKHFKNLNFWLSNGGCFERFKTMNNLKKDLRRQNLDGIVFYVDKIDKISQQSDEIHVQFHQSQASEYDDECCQIKCFQLDKEAELKKLHLKFLLKLSMQTPEITLGIEFNDEYDEVVNKLHEHILRQFQVKISKDLFQQKMIVEKTKEQIRPNSKIGHISTLEQNSIINVYFKHGMVPRLIKQHIRKYYLKVFDVPEGKIKKPILIEYDLIKFKTFGDIYQEYFKKKANTSHTKLYLKVLGVVIPYYQNLEKIQHFFNHFVLNIGEVISEKDGFLQTLRQHTKQIEFNNIFEELQLEYYDANRAKQFHIGQIQNIRSTNDKSSSVSQHIYLYSSQLKVKKEKKPIYNIINTFMRTMFNLEHSFRKIYAQNWKFKFIKNLVNSLKQIKSVQGKVFRGVTYLPIERKGQIISFKEFLSTSRDLRVAKAFACRNLQNAEEGIVQHHTIFEMSLRGTNARDIKVYTKHKQQQEVLLQPFSKFLIKDIYDVHQNGKVFHYFVLQSIQQEQDTPKLRAKIIAWVDDNLQEGQEKAQSYFYKSPSLQGPLIFRQFISTSQLITFMHQKKEILCAEQADVLFISDMKRIENGHEIKNAGVRGLKQIIKIQKFKSPHMIFYVGYKIGAQKEFEDADFTSSVRENIFITENQQELREKIEQFFRNPIRVGGESSFCQIF